MKKDSLLRKPLYWLASLPCAVLAKASEGGEIAKGDVENALIWMLLAPTKAALWGTWIGTYLAGMVLCWLVWASLAWVSKLFHEKA